MSHLSLPASGHRPARAQTLIDSHKRTIQYLRLSLTSACHMRCVYCRPDFHHNTADDLLTPIELENIVRHLVQDHGLRKVRLTGGDPTARGDLENIITRLARIDGIDDLAMTTNGLSLATRARAYADAGLMRVNLSLDSLDSAQFARMTGIDGLKCVLAGIEAAHDANLTPIKLNTVVLRGENEEQIPGLVRYASECDAAIRFIELMPMGPLASQWAERYVPASEVRARLDEIVTSWEPLPRGSDSAENFRAVLDDGRSVTIGFITPMSCNFCSACNRVRITSDGSLYPCLMDRPSGSLLAALRPRFDAELFDTILSEGLARKASEHPAQGFVTMTVIGG